MTELTSPPELTSPAEPPHDASALATPATRGRWKSLGEPRRKNGAAALTGTAQYLDDVTLTGMLRCAVLRSPHPAARIVSIDTTRAASAPGVVEILTGEQARALCPTPLPHVFDPVNVGGQTTDFYCLATDVVRYVGQPVAAVAAETAGDAEAALKLIDVEYEELDFVLDAEDSLLADAPKVFEEWEDNAVGRYHFVEGEPDEAMAAAEFTVTDDIVLQRYYTAPLETRGYLASWQRDNLLFYSNTQMPHPSRSHLSTVLGIPENAIRVVTPMSGGGFGHKFHGFEEEFVVALLSKKARRPVKWMESRAESMYVGAREFTHTITAGFDAEGRILALKDRVLANVGALGPWGGWCMAFPASTTLPGPYRIKHYDIETLPVVTNKAPWSGARGYGKESACLALEHIVDKVAEHLDLDPAEVRRRNFIPADEFPYWTIAKVIDSGNYQGALDQVLELSDYAGLRDMQAQARADGRLVGVGLAFELTPEGADFAGSFFRGYDTSTVRVDPSGSVMVLTGVTSPGSGSDTAIAQLVAAEFGIPYALVELRQGDTDACPYGFGNFSSRALTTGGGSAVLAARDVKAIMATVAAAVLGRSAAELTFADGKIFASDEPAAAVAFADIADQVYRRTIPLPMVEDYPQLEATRSDGPNNYKFVPDERGGTCAYPSYPFAAHVCAVELDAETGHTTILDYTCVDDCGVVINHRLVRGQLQGAIAMGIGGALMEHIPYSSSGHPLTATFKEYLVPRALDLPEVRLGSQETPSPFTTLGTKGAGESAVGGSLASVTAAVNDAMAPLGAAINRLPLSPPRVLAALTGATPPAARPSSTETGPPSTSS